MPDPQIHVRLEPAALPVFEEEGQTIEIRAIVQGGEPGMMLVLEMHEDFPCKVRGSHASMSKTKGESDHHAASWTVMAYETGMPREMRVSSRGGEFPPLVITAKDNAEDSQLDPPRSSAMTAGAMVVSPLETDDTDKPAGTRVASPVVMAAPTPAIGQLGGLKDKQKDKQHETGITIVTPQNDLLGNLDEASQSDPDNEPAVMLHSDEVADELGLDPSQPPETEEDDHAAIFRVSGGGAEALRSGNPNLKVENLLDPQATEEAEEDVEVIVKNGDKKRLTEYNKGTAALGAAVRAVDKAGRAPNPRLTMPKREDPKVMSRRLADTDSPTAAFEISKRGRTRTSGTREKTPDPIPLATAMPTPSARPPMVPPPTPKPSPEPIEAKLESNHRYNNSRKRVYAGLGLLAITAITALMVVSAGGFSIGALWLSTGGSRNAAVELNKVRSETGTETETKTEVPPEAEPEQVEASPAPAPAPESEPKEAPCQIFEKNGWVQLDIYSGKMIIQCGDQFFLSETICPEGSKICFHQKGEQIKMNN